MQAFSRKYRLLCRQFADIYPAHRFCKLPNCGIVSSIALLLLLHAGKLSHIFQSLVQIHPHAFLDSKRADASDRHVRSVPPPHPAQASSPSHGKCLVFCIVNPGISRTHDQHRLSVHQKRQGLCNPPCFRVQASAASSTVAEETGNSRI